jgi:hypothetical protein
MYSETVLTSAFSTFPHLAVGCNRSSESYIVNPKQASVIVLRASPVVLTFPLSWRAAPDGGFRKRLV